ncbi:hypothetical protein FH972_000761 [Carpinus fangiana]|uniref:Rx N-terminal domain-containing protein n=1 Tax=Carpinus fangiana TaxID=176857 RepID=A0A5N6Q9Q9_9ROSI|nr:hypothetical protein FH972_000761 [Carpinus fangiana]
MTETVVTLVINELVQLIAHESKFLRGVHRDVVDIRDELESIQCFLKDADKGDLQDGVKTWVKQVREIAYHIEDVIDEYVLHMAQHRHQQSLIGFLHKIGHIFKKLKPRHDISTKIQDIKISVCEIKERSERYGFRFVEQGSSSSESNVTWHDPRVHKLQPLSQDKAWELFCRKAYHFKFQRYCPKELVKLSMDIVKKCEGLPLAIVAIGGLLSTKEKVPFEWKKLHDSLSSELEFLEVLDTTSYGKSRRLSIHNARKDVFETSEYSQVRSIFLFNITELPRSFIVKLFKKFKLLKVLDFEDAPIDYLPQEVGNLFHLKHLSLRRTKVKILPKSVGRLYNLQTLNVAETAVDPLPCVQALPNLFTLSLNHVYNGEQLHFEEGGFRKLKKLTLRELKTLKMVEIDKGSLPNLVQLDIGPCPLMKEVPAGIQHLKSLKILDFYEMHREFVLRIQPDRGEDYWKVKKVTTIRLMYRIKGERYQIYQLGDSDLLERLQR